MISETHPSSQEVEGMVRSLFQELRPHGKIQVYETGGDAGFFFYRPHDAYTVRVVLDCDGPLHEECFLDLYKIVESSSATKVLGRRGIPGEPIVYPGEPDFRADPHAWAMYQSEFLGPVYGVQFHMAQSDRPEHRERFQPRLREIISDLERQGAVTVERIQ